MPGEAPGLEDSSISGETGSVVTSSCGQKRPHTWGSHSPKKTSTMARDSSPVRWPAIMSRMGRCSGYGTGPSRLDSSRTSGSRSLQLSMGNAYNEHDHSVVKDSVDNHVVPSCVHAVQAPHSLKLLRSLAARILRQDVQPAGDPLLDALRQTLQYLRRFRGEVDAIAYDSARAL